MDRIVLRDSPWLSKDGLLLVGGSPPQVMILRPSHGLAVKELINGKALEVTENNEEVTNSLVAAGIARPSHSFSQDAMESVTTEIEIVLVVDDPGLLASEGLAGLLEGPWAFPHHSIKIIATSHTASQLLEEILPVPIDVKTVARQDAYRQGIGGCSAPVVAIMTDNVLVSPLDIRALALELLENNADIVVPRIIGARERSRSGALAPTISHFEERSALSDSGTLWSDNSNGERTSFESGSCLIVNRHSAAEMEGFKILDPGIAPREFLARAISNYKKVIYEPSVVARQVDSKSYVNFVSSAYKEGGRDAVLASKYPYAKSEAIINLSHLVSLASPIAFGIRGIGVSALNEALFLARTGQKLARSRHGDAAAIRFSLKSNMTALNESGRHLRRTFGAPILVLSLFSKRARRLALAGVLTEISRAVESTPKDEILPDIALGWVQDLAYSFGLWTTAIARRAPLAALPRPLTTHIRKQAEPPITTVR